jgi:hypothetical protein
MAFSENGSRESLPRASNHDERSGSAGLGIFGAANELDYRQAANEFVFEYGIDEISYFEFGRAAGHMEFKFTARAIIERIDALLSA